jgi:acetyl-CoA carboxylase carboxyltransferase component
LGADFAFAWPKAEIAVMGADSAVPILYPKEAKEGARSAFIQEKIQEYRDTVMTPKIALERGYITDVIEPGETRSKVAGCFRLLVGKQAADTLIKKHGNMPM